MPNFYPPDIMASEDLFFHSVCEFFYFCFRSSTPIVSAVRRSANQRVSSTPQEGIFFVQLPLSNMSLMSTPMTSSGAWLTSVGSLVTLSK